MIYITNTPAETESIAVQLASQLNAPCVVAMFGDMGMGKTVFVRGLARGLGINPDIVSSPTFALVHDYGELIHFDMYRITSWDDLDATGFDDYLAAGRILAVEWSENIEAALPANTVRVIFESLGDTQRRITINTAEVTS